MSKLTIGFSPCPNDTFIFDAMVHQKVDTEGLDFEVMMADVEELNEMAFAKKLDITKLSYHAFAYCVDDYQLLHAGSALGNGVGPLLIAKRPLTEDDLAQATIAIPGQYTTANLLLSLAYPQAKSKIPMLFSDVEDAVIAGAVDAGLIIHENRFTYEDKGLLKIKDLGEFWEAFSGHPIPLGGIVIRRGLETALQQKVDRVLRRSLEYAFANTEDVLPFVKDFAQEMDQDVMLKHIGLYVNEFTLDLGEKGRAAIEFMFRHGRETGSLPDSEFGIFV